MGDESTTLWGVVGQSPLFFSQRGFFSRAHPLSLSLGLFFSLDQSPSNTIMVTITIITIMVHDNDDNDCMSICLSVCLSSSGMSEYPPTHLHEPTLKCCVI